MLLFRTLRLGALSLALSATCGCGSNSQGQGFGGAGGNLLGNGGGGSGSGSGGSGSGYGQLGGDGGGGVTTNCSDAAKFVYLVSDSNILFRFDPGHLQITQLGPLQCPTSGSVNSMAVDRHATAWVNYDDGNLFEVNTSTLACQPTSFAPGQAGFTDALGMGFSSDAPGSESETLFVSDNTGPGGLGVPGGGKGLAKVDLTTMTLTPLGGYTGPNAGYNAELTGTGDAKLYGFFTTTPADLAEIDKTSGATPMPISLPTVNASTGGYAFSYWGGDFWFYTDSSGGNGTSVTHYVTATNTASVVLSNLGYTVVGAGVSTCAPQTPVQ
jgi:hypothetical protein